ncbi:MAG TPA: hypothetical protein VFM21_01600 [Terriglobia bacterium]|nr:hypothetical protein [Terriglobia bacterium]
MTATFLKELESVAWLLEICAGFVAVVTTVHLAVPAKFKTGNHNFCSDEEAAVREFQARRTRTTRVGMVALGLNLATVAVAQSEKFGLSTNFGGCLAFAAVCAVVAYLFFVIYACRCPACGKHSQRGWYASMFPSRCPWCGIRLAVEGH